MVTLVQSRGPMAPVASNSNELTFFPLLILVRVIVVIVVVTGGKHSQLSWSLTTPPPSCSIRGCEAKGLVTINTDASWSKAVALYN